MKSCHVIPGTTRSPRPSKARGSAGLVPHPTLGSGLLCRRLACECEKENPRELPPAALLPTYIIFILIKIAMHGKGKEDLKLYRERFKFFLNRAMCNRLTDLENVFMVAGGRRRGKS